MHAEATFVVPLMELAVVAYPTLDEFDRQWIEAFRMKHDPQAARIAAHFTLVFPVDAAANELEAELRDAACWAQPITFVIRRVEVVHDTVGGATHIVLVPDEGGMQIVDLHDRLYADCLRDHLRSDIPFVPHMTIGATPDPSAADRLVSEIGIRPPVVSGTVATLHLVDVGGSQVRTIAICALGS